MNPITAATSVLHRRRRRRRDGASVAQPVWRLLLAELTDAVVAIRRRLARRP